MILLTNCKLSLLLLTCLMICSCSSNPVRNRESDKNLRVMIDPESLDAKNHVILQNDLVATGRFYVIDRAKGFNAVKKEQNRQHASDERFSDPQKYAHWGKLYGAGAVIVAHLQCTDNPSTENVLYGLAHLATLGIFYERRICAQFLELVDTNSGEVVTSVRNDFKTDNEGYTMSWSETVSKLLDSYPKSFVPTKKSKILTQYEAESAEESQRVRERNVSSEEDK